MRPFCFVFLVAGGFGEVLAAGGVTPEGAEFFETHIRPVLAEKCYGCHSSQAKKLKGGLRLDTAERLRAGGESGPIIVPNKPDDSPLISALKYESNEMPPSGKLPDAVINDFVKWVAMGAARPTHRSRPHRRRRKETRSGRTLGLQTSAKGNAASQCPTPRPRAATSIDSYSQNWKPPTCLRRPKHRHAHCCDVSTTTSSACRPRPRNSTHSPPTPVTPTTNRRSTACLASPRFGERWVRHWLDVARYSDTKGYVFQEDRNYKGAFAYRDWVINSFNSDLPYDKFVVDQIAADQTGDATCAAATGFLTLGRRYLNSQPDIINDRIDVVTRGLLGMTVACARCHDHKYDPIPAADYYALYGVFASCEEKPHDDRPPEMVDSAKPFDPYVFLRGSPGNRGPNTERRFLTALTPDHKPKPFEHGSGRLELANDIASRDNPLTARVWVNRVWDQLFGKGLVDTPSDFGVRGTPPTHPELLDTLACDFMDDRWSTKHLIRRVVLSATYRQASETRPECVAADPENRLLWRANRRRLDLESLRDSLLAVAARLDDKMGGPSVSIVDPPFSTRRSVYGFIERQNLPAFFRTFDFANPNTHTPERSQTTIPQQALFLMNSPFTIEQASFLATRSEKPDSTVKSDAATTRVRRIERLFRFALGREPSIDEVTDALEFVDRGDATQTTKALEQIAWQFGWGAYDEAAHTVHFQPLPRYVNNSWQGGDKLPDPTIGWVVINAAGGHPGDAAHAVIRRWTAPAAGTLRIEGLLAHSAVQGDGVRGRIVSSRGGTLGSWDAHHNEAVTNPAAFAVEQGDTIDFIADSRDG